MTSKPRTPCRLFVFLATAAPLAVVLRRGPSDWARLTLWHTDSDHLEHGQWLKGRVFERRSDLSPDGRLFAAFIRKGGGRLGSPAKADSWLAISRPPWFSALGVWFVGGTYYTGGYFPDASSLWIGFMEQPPDVGMLPPWLRIVGPKDIPYVDGTNEWPDRTVHFNRLLRDGWRLVRNENFRTTWQKKNSGRELIMDQAFQDFAVYGGPYVVRYSLQLPDESRVDLGSASWADWDQNGRLVLARNGRLLRIGMDLEATLIHDFNEQAPSRLRPPPNATQWPSAFSFPQDSGSEVEGAS